MLGTPPFYFILFHFTILVYFLYSFKKIPPSFQMSHPNSKFLTPLHAPLLVNLTEALLICSSLHLYLCWYVHLPEHILIVLCAIIR